MHYRKELSNMTEDYEMSDLGAEDRGEPPSKRHAPTRAMPVFNMPKPQQNGIQLFPRPRTVDLNSNNITPTKAVRDLNIESPRNRSPHHHNRTPPKIFTSTPLHAFAAISTPQNKQRFRRPVVSTLRGNKSYTGALSNPFSPANRMLKNAEKKFASYNINLPNYSLSSGNTSEVFGSLKLDMDSGDELEIEQKRQCRLEDLEATLYHTFEELEVIGKGDQGEVFKCQNRLSSCVYAVKKTNVPANGNKVKACQELNAFSTLPPHNNTVHFYGAWYEAQQIHLQTEFCNGGSLGAAIDKCRGRGFSEGVAKVVLRDCAKGLRHLHANGFAHIDVKPDNIFICGEGDVRSSVDSFIAGADGFEEGKTRFKLGDFGHVVLVEGSDYVEEGDSRYLCPNLLNGDHKNLPKADIFSLGLSVYEAATGTFLPKNSSEIYKQLQDIPGYSRDFQDLLKLMVSDKSEVRPTAAQIVDHEIFLTTSTTPRISEQQAIENSINCLKGAIKIDPNRLAEITHLLGCYTNSLSSPNYPTPCGNTFTEYSHNDSPGKSPKIKNNKPKRNSYSRNSRNKSLSLKKG